MAGDWIKVQKATARKPEVLRVADTLGIHPDHAFGLCVRFWFWCDDQLTDGHAVSVTNVTLDSVVGHAGFATALVDVGWLRVRNGSLEIPNFNRHLSESAKNRSLSAERKAKQRHADVTKMSRSKRDKSVTREEKRREEDNNPTSTQDRTFPIGSRPLGEMSLNSFFDNPETRRLLTLWGQTSAIDEIRADSALVKCQGLGWTIEKINRSIEKSYMGGWRDLYDPDQQRGKPAKDYS